HCRNGGFAELLHDQRGCAFGQEKGVPRIDLEIGKTLLMRRCQIWQDWQAMLRKDRDRLYCFALDLRNCDRSEWAKVVDPAGDQLLNRVASAGIGNCVVLTPIAALSSSQAR